MSTKVVQPSREELDRRKVVGINSETVTNIYSTDFPGHHPGEDHAWSIRKFSQGLSVQIHSNESYDLSFSLIGIDSSLANAFRRICIAEVPSFAIERVFVNNNTSIIADEVFSHRLGLVPLTGSKAGFERLKWYNTEDEEKGIAGELEATDLNTIMMNLRIECSRNPDASPDEIVKKKKYINSSVYASDITYEPNEQQAGWFKDGLVKAVNPDLLLNKLRPGHILDMRLHAIMGIGADHAKFSPVATATYRLLPLITITKPILGVDASKFQSCFPPGVVGLEDATDEDVRRAGGDSMAVDGLKKAVVKNAFKDTVSRECLRHEEFESKVKLGRVRDHFIYSIESTGQLRSDDIFLESIKVLRNKAELLKLSLEKIEEG